MTRQQIPKFPYANACTPWLGRLSYLGLAIWTSLAATSYTAQSEAQVQAQALDVP